MMMSLSEMASMLPKLPEHVLIGLSGGADSVALFRLLVYLRDTQGLALEAVHVNHGLRGEASDGDEQFVRELCDRHGVRLLTYRAEPPQNPGEDWARKAILPSAWAVASARGIARFYNRLCGYDGKPPLIRPETLEAALKPCRHPSDPLPDAETMKRDWFMIFGMGYGLWGEADRIGRVFGHGGAGGSEGLCDLRQKLVVGFTCNFEDPYTYKELRRKLYELVGMRMRYTDDDTADIQTIQMNSQTR